MTHTQLTRHTRSGATSDDTPAPFMWLSSPSINLGGMQHDRRTTRSVQRSAPTPRPGVVDGCAALAGLGFGAVLAAVVTGESAGALRAPGGPLTAAGRLAGFTGAYLMLIMVVLVARLPWLERVGRAGSAGPLASPGKPVGARPDRRPRSADHPRLRAGGSVRGAARSVGAGHLLSRHARRLRRLRPAGDGRGHLGAAGPAPNAVRDLVGRPPVPLPRAGARVRAPDRHRGLVHRPPAGPGSLWITIWAATAGMVLAFRVAAADLAEPAPSAPRRGGPR